MATQDVLSRGKERREDEERTNNRREQKTAEVKATHIKQKPTIHYMNTYPQTRIFSFYRRSRLFPSFNSSINTNSLYSIMCHIYQH